MALNKKEKKRKRKTLSLSLSSPHSPAEACGLLTPRGPVAKSAQPKPRPALRLLSTLCNRRCGPTPPVGANQALAVSHPPFFFSWPSQALLDGKQRRRLRFPRDSPRGAQAKRPNKEPKPSPCLWFASTPPGVALATTTARSGSRREETKAIAAIDAGCCRAIVEIHPLLFGLR